MKSLKTSVKIYSFDCRNEVNIEIRYLQGLKLWFGATRMGFG